jgi:UDP-N-acetylmuramoylalanine--D-glutamate ligase
VPIWSEVELAWRLRANPAAPWLVVTGTNGKTTTVGMTRAILAAAGLSVTAAGNIGLPLVSAVARAATEVFVVELSSFQLHHTYSLTPWAAALLNLAPDHIDWHGSFEAYAAAKARVYEGTQSVLVYNAADRLTRQMAETAETGPDAQAVAFSLAAPLVGELGLVESLLIDRAFWPERRRAGRELATLDDLIHLAGPDGWLAPHLVSNALAAAALALSLDVAPESIAQGLGDFKTGQHRGTVVAETAGVRFVDDSKATNTHAADSALAACAPGSAVWVAGGLAKGASFTELVNRRADRLRGVVLIGLDQRDLAEALAGLPDVPVVSIEPGPGLMDRVVAAASRLAQPGDVVLLAPASASMDQFTDYAERGRLFAEAARRLADQTGQAAP